MSENVIYTLIAVSVIVAIVATVYIVKAVKFTREQQNSLKEEEQRVQKRYEEQRAYLVESVQVISAAVGNDEKLSITEACMRLNALLESLAPQLLSDPEFKVINDVYAKTSHIPIKGDWKALSKQERWGFMQEMKRVDAEFSEDVRIAAAKLKAYDFSLAMH